MMRATVRIVSHGLLCAVVFVGSFFDGFRDAWEET